MGTSYTPKYRAEYQDQKGWHWISYMVQDNGPATEANAEKLRKALNESFQPGGVNEAVSKMNGFIPHVSRLVIVRQSDNKQVANARAPMFEVI